MQVIIDNRGAAKRSIEYLQALLAGDAIHGKNLNYSINNATSRHITIEGGERMRQRESREVIFISLGTWENQPLLGLFYFNFYA